MAITTITSREFNQDRGRAKRATEQGPVVITDRGQPAHVLMRYEDFRRLSTSQKSLAEALVDDSPEADFDFEFEPFKGRISAPIDFDLDD
jgi:prevent-host-death family protein